MSGLEDTQLGFLEDPCLVSGFHLPLGSPEVSPALPWDGGPPALPQMRSCSPVLAVPPVQSGWEGALCAQASGKFLIFNFYGTAAGWRGWRTLEHKNFGAGTSSAEREQLCSHIGLFMLLWELEFSALTRHFDLGSSRNHILGTFFQGEKKKEQPPPVVCITGWETKQLQATPGVIKVWLKCILLSDVSFV